MTRLLADGALVDVYRQLEPAATDACYTWWSNRGQAYAKNVGWRLDYQLATRTLAATAKSARIYKERRFSDHAPLIIEYGLGL
jgi:exodeoxyribonuclease-3